jgi:SAM-dependent methyltransferase
MYHDRTAARMIPVLYITIILVVLIGIIAVAWRFASRRLVIPCPVWMSGLLDAPFTHGISARTRKSVERLDLRPGMNVLDAGCGPGRLTLPIAESVGTRGEVTAIDIQEGMLRQAQDRAGKRT